MFYDMQVFGLEEFEFVSWEEAFTFWKEQHPPGPLVRTIYLVNLTYHTVFVSPPGHKGNAIFLAAALGYPMPGQTHDPKDYTGKTGMHRGLPISNEAFSSEAHDKAVEDQEWDEAFFRKTGRHWQGHKEQGPTEHKHESKADPAMGSEPPSLDRAACLNLFGLQTGFSKRDLATAYRKLVSLYHPDKVASLAQEFKELAEHKTKQMNQARELLTKDFK